MSTPDSSATTSSQPAPADSKAQAPSDLPTDNEQYTKEFQEAILSLARKHLRESPSLTPQQILDYVSAGVNQALQTLFHDPQIAVSRPAPPPAPKKLVRAYVDGCFDLMHSGHYNAIRQAKALCDVLVVGVHSDKEIEKHKGPPVMHDEERVAAVKACKWADEIAFDTPYDPTIELLDKLNCDFCVHGDDIPTTSSGQDAYGEVKAAGRMKIIKRTEGVSTTDLVGRLLLMTKNHHIAPDKGPKPSPGSPSLVALSSNIDGVPAVSLAGSPATSPAAQTESKSAMPYYTPGISNFLPTTWRISQFSNNRTPARDDKIVYIDGAFDLFHVGHIETLKQAKALGTFLYVGIHDDITVNMHKGKNYPIMNLHERVLNVLSCRYVDEVVIGAPWKLTKDLITTLNIHVVASGSNTKMDPAFKQEDDDPHALPKQMGIFVQIPSVHPLLTEDVVSRIIDNRLRYENRNAKRTVKEQSYLATRAYVPETANADQEAAAAAASSPQPPAQA